MARFIDRTGQRFGMLTVLREDGKIYKGVSAWICRCDCGQEKRVASSQLQSGHTRSCGCMVTAMNKARAKKEGRVIDHPMYKTFIAMRQRCTNPRNDRYKSYGGRGIKVCPRWMNGEDGKTGFECFLEDVGEKPTPSHTLDRIDTDRDYEPGNIRWATVTEQNQNCQDTIWVEFEGRTWPFSELVRAQGLDYPTAYGRHKLGWPLANIFTAPKRIVRTARRDASE